MTSLIFCFFEKFSAYTLFLPSFIVVRHQMVELNWGGAFLPPPPIHYRGIRDPVQNRVNEDSKYGVEEAVAQKQQTVYVQNQSHHYSLLCICS